MKRFLIFTIVAGLGLALSIAAFTFVARANHSYLILSKENLDQLPVAFRVSRENVSGSAQITPKGLQKILEIIKNKKLTVVDLRQEPHAFLQGDAVSWYAKRNWYYKKPVTTDEIIQTEKKLTLDLADKIIALIYKHKKFPTPYLTKSAMTEEALAHSMNISYYRLPIRDHTRPDDATVDAYIAFAKQLKEDDWIHFHCAAGKGRTTTLLVMNECMRAAQFKSLEEIIKEQRALGGINLLAIHAKKEWEEPLEIARKDFILKFYQYCKEVPDFKQSWIEWNLVKNATFGYSMGQITLF